MVLPLSIQSMDIPKHHMNLFTPKFTRMDFTGNIFVLYEQTDALDKFILLFTCLNVRAIYLQLVPDMGEPNLLLFFPFLLRFCNLYSIPEFIY